MTAKTLMQKVGPFLEYLSNWQEGLPILSLNQAIPNPQISAILSVDVISGFCHQGPLASPRVKGIIEPIVSLLQRGWAKGVRHILLIQDTHEPDAVEFAMWPSHCVRGTPESEAVPEFQALPFFDRMVIIPKNSISSSLNTGLNNWLTTHPEVDTFIVVGDCTDLCTYQLAMHLRLDANARQLQRRVILPANCVDTYDLPVEVASQIGALPHDGELLHIIFLYHMALNGIVVVKRIE